MTAPLPNDARAQLDRLYEEMRPKSLYPLWEVLSALVTPTPRSPAKAWKWDYASARDHLLRIGHTKVKVIVVFVRAVINAVSTAV